MLMAAFTKKVEILVDLTSDHGFPYYWNICGFWVKMKNPQMPCYLTKRMTVLRI